MALGPGTRIGSFEIIASLGAGGMGEVWRARDTTLNREVALKVLPAAFASDPERLGRFKREAQILAALNHHNIAAIHGFEDGQGTGALVLELVDGITLADRIAAGAVPIDEALPIARQIAEALEAAHAQGIVHRDLKPSNIKIRRDGTVKVLDFGLAKALEPSRAATIDAPTITSPAMTLTGVILGTAAYMSPEQARGETVDARADIWAFGCVLYEMLTGTRLFDGRTISDVIAAVLTRDPLWDRLPPALHPRIRLLLERCLEKDVRDRYHTIADAGVDIRRVISSPAVAISEPLTRTSAFSRPGLWAGAVVLAALASGVGGWLLKPSVVTPVTRLSHVLPADQSLTEGPRSSLDVSPDGTAIVYVANNRLFHRALNGLDASAIRGTEGAPSNPVFSPDGRFIAFWNAKSGQIERVAVSGGTSLRLTPAVGIYGASWTPDGTLLYGQEDGIWKIPAEHGGQPEHVIKIEPAQRAHGPQLLPDGRSVLFTLLSTAASVGSGAWDNAEIVVQSLDSGKRETIVRGGDARYVSSGHLVFALDTVLYAVRFDASARSIRGTPIPVVEGVQRAVRTPGSSAAANYSIADDGTLVYLQGQVDGRAISRSLTFVDREGKPEPVLDEQRAYWRPRVSPDGTQIAVEVADGPTEQIWITDIKGRTVRPLAVDGTLNVFAAWTPDGQSVVFRSNRNGRHGVYRQRVDGGEGAVPVTLTDAEPIVTDVSRDGVIVFAEGSQTGARTIKTILGSTVSEFLATPAIEHMAVFSPDSRWMAYVSNESGRYEVYVRPYPKRDGIEHRISLDGGTAPVWSRKGDELYYRSDSGSLVAVPVTMSSGFSVARSHALFQVSGRFRISGNAAAYDVTPDGRFVMVTQPASTASSPRQIVVVQNWLSELNRLVP